MSYTVFLTTYLGVNINDFRNGMYDGSRYLYMYSEGAGKIIRYDTRASFTLIGSYETYTSSAGGGGMVTDGRYIYFTNLIGTNVVQYDSTLSFTSAGSYSSYNFTNILLVSHGLDNHHLMVDISIFQMYGAVVLVHMELYVTTRNYLLVV